MYARVARWEGATGEALRRFADEIGQSPEPPPGVPATGFLMLMDAENGRSLGIALFETEEDMRKGDEALNAMSPDTSDAGTRVSVELYEVGAELRT
jgi:hypothetical protein